MQHFSSLWVNEDYLLELGTEITRKKNRTREARLGRVYGICSRYGQKEKEGCSWCSVEELRMSLEYWIRGTEGEEKICR